MPSFLSPAWVAALDAALASAPVPGAEPFPPFVVGHVVTGAPAAAEAEYRITVSDQGMRARTDRGVDDPVADLVFATDYDTAAALNRGELSAQEALEAGRLEVRGRLDRITGARKLLLAITDAARGLRADTTY
jgi:hypothetical protein